MLQLKKPQHAAHVHVHEQASRILNPCRLIMFTLVLQDVGPNAAAASSLGLTKAQSFWRLWESCKYLAASEFCGCCNH